MITVIEWILDFFFDAAVETSLSKKVPRWLRITMGIIVITILLAIVGLLFYVGIKQRNAILIIVICILILAIIGYGVLREFNQRRQ